MRYNLMELPIQIENYRILLELNVKKMKGPHGYPPVFNQKTAGSVSAIPHNIKKKHETYPEVFEKQE